MSRLTAADLSVILLDQYRLSDIEFALGTTLEDLQYGLDIFIEEHYDELVGMIEEDQEDTHWDS